MTDVEEIQQLLSRYCHAMDDGDLVALAQILTEDVRFDMGQVVEGRDELVEFIGANLWPAGRHLSTNAVITLDGESAHAQSDWLWLDPSLKPSMAGRYADEFRRVEGVWALAARRFIFTHQPTPA